MGTTATRLGRACAAGLLAGAVLMAPVAATAQTGPTGAEVARYSGLHAAAHKGDVARIEQLAAAGARVNERDSHGRTPLHVATFAGQREAIRALVKAGADLGLLENDRYDAVTIAAVANDEETLRVLLSLGASARLTTSRYDGTALIAAAHLGHSGVVRQLIAAGAPLDHVNNLGWTALLEAVVLGSGGLPHQQVVQLLVEHGADVNIGDRNGVTPLGHARARGFREIEVILVRAGAR